MSAATSTIPEILEQARQAIHEAVAAGNGTDRQRSAAHHAESLANTILLEQAATTAQRERASYYLEEAIGIQHPQPAH
ncbi:hypothetical protein [Williamsia sp. D3]|uniref:hypothetical protein n=1 Tax=Williamsia sp. D3 TaxID=1313067 RepID=UPI0003D2BC5A|nr:hypothetical protein [Williamsia sp. D3]ETD30783.1 hypothetical protein W823_22870 [Williamsia sp. D3]PZO61725.1 MAG: hypothetical protein DI635_14575 [Pseudoxanthomonas suwonensis]